jgi:hypothetical protein
MMPGLKKPGILSRGIFILLLLYISVSGFAGDSAKPLIKNIWLINSTVYTKFSPPGMVPIGIDVSRDVYYKITGARDTIVTGGLLNKGSNIIEISDDNLFKESASFFFLLILKIGEQVKQKKLLIDIRLASIPGKGEAGEKKEKKINKTANAEYSVSMFIEDRFILEEKKNHQKKVEIAVRKGRIEGNLGQPSLVDGSYQTLQGGGLPVFPLVMMLLKKAVSGKPKTKRAPTPKPQHLTIKFMRTDMEGEEKLIKASITVKLSDL